MPRKPKPAPLRLDDFERIVTAWGEKCGGPGWANMPVWVLISNAQTGILRTHCIQPADQSDAMINAFPWSVLAHEQMRSAAEAMVQKVTA